MRSEKAQPPLNKGIVVDDRTNFRRSARYLDYSPLHKQTEVGKPWRAATLTVQERSSVNEDTDREMNDEGVWAIGSVDR
jgi:hypothetical protein